MPLTPAQLRARLGGVIAFPCTPFKKNLTLDLPGFRKNLSRLAEHELCAIVVGAGTGEIHSLSPSEHLEIVKAALEVVDGRLPVLAGVGFSPQIAIDMTRASTAAGVDGILIFPPYYPGDPNDLGMHAYYQNVARATKRAVIIYSRDYANFSPASVERLTSIPNLVAFKDGQGDLRRFLHIMTKVGDRLHWIGGAGDDLVPGYYSIGIRTYTSSIANIAPRLSLALHATAAGGDRATLNRLMQQFVQPLYALRLRGKGYEVSVMKAMMDLQGQAGGFVRPPLNNVTEDELAVLKNLLPKWKPWL
jgi:5-dehydro-4-deoxyglucarate dehydratase